MRDVLLWVLFMYASCASCSQSIMQSDINKIKSEVQATHRACQR